MLWALYSEPRWAGKRVFEVYTGDVSQDLIPYVGQLVLPIIPAEGWVINPYEYGLLDDPGDGVWLPLNCGEIVQFGGMSWGVGMVIEGDYEVFL